MGNHTVALNGVAAMVADSVGPTDIYRGGPGKVRRLDNDGIGASCTASASCWTHNR